MFTQEQLANILFVDIETVSVRKGYEELSPSFQTAWDKKAGQLARWDGTGEGLDPAKLWRERAAIFAEFGKVVCISCGYLKFTSGEPQMHLKSYFGQEEASILDAFRTTVDQWMYRDGRPHPDRNLCAHNGKEFDFPYLGRRYLINGTPLPRFLQEIQSKKPWEIRLLDTMALWKFGDIKSFTSLDLLCTVLDIPSPKDDMDGSEVGRVFWEDRDFGRIARYCEKDVLATAQVMLRFSGMALIPDHNAFSKT